MCLCTIWVEGTGREGINSLHQTLKEEYDAPTKDEDLCYVIFSEAHPYIIQYSRLTT